MKRIYLVLFAVLCVASAVLGQNLGPGIRWGPPSGLVPVNIVGVPTSEWTPPTPPAYPVVGLWAHLDYRTFDTVSPYVWSDLSGNGNDFLSPVNYGYSTNTAPLGVKFEGAGGGGGFWGFYHLATSPMSTASFSVVMVGTPYAAGWGGGLSFWTGNPAIGGQYTFLYAPYGGGPGVQMYDYSVGATYPAGSVTAGSRYTYALSCNGATMSFFLNGVKVDEKPQPPTTVFDTQAVVFPGDFTGGVFGYVSHVWVEQMYFYTLPLSDAEIAGTVW